MGSAILVELVAIQPIEGSWASHDVLKMRVETDAILRLSVTNLVTLTYSGLNFGFERKKPSVTKLLPNKLVTLKVVKDMLVLNLG